MPNNPDFKAEHQPGGDLHARHVRVHHPCAPHRPARSKTTRINWEALKERYVMGVLPPGFEHADAREWPSLADVAREFGASRGRVEAVSAAGNWPEQRESFRQRLRELEDLTILSQLAAKHVRARVASFSLATRGLMVIDGLLQKDDLTLAELCRLMVALRTSQEVAEIAIHGFPA